MTRNIRKDCRSLLLGGVSLGAVLAQGGAAFAQAAPQVTPVAASLQDVVVTAERRTANLQKTAAAVTVLKGNDLLKQGKFTWTDILQSVPGVYGGSSDSTTSGPPTGNDSPAAGVTIRGISSNVGVPGDSISTVPAVAAYVDDVYNGIDGGYDIDRFEVLRGPQGTLYGRSATAGVLAIHTRNPDLEKVTGDLSFEGGDHGVIHATGAVSVPLIKDELALRVAVNRYQRNGYDVTDSYGASHETDAKAKLLYRPNGDVSLLLGAAMQNRTISNGGIEGNMTAPNSFDYIPFPLGQSKMDLRQYWAELNWNLNGVQLTYLPAFRTWNQNATVYFVAPGNSVGEQPLTTPLDQYITQELRLSSEDDAAIKWQTGAFYYDNLLHNTNTSVYAASQGLLFSANIRRKTQNVGVFAEGSAPLTTNLKLTLGLRYDNTSVNTNEDYTSNANALCNTPIGFVFSCAVAPPNSPLAGLPDVLHSVDVSGSEGQRTFNNVTFKARVEYDLTPANLLYGVISSGFLPGDVQVGTNMAGLPAVSVYQSEQLTAYEFGTKNRFLDNRLQINGDVYYNDYAGYQASIITQAGNPNSAMVFSVPLRILGAELEAQYQLTPNDHASLSVSEADSRFHNIPQGFANAVAERALWGYSPTTVSATYDHVFPLADGSSLTARGEADWRAGYDVFPTTPLLASEGGEAYVHQSDFILGNLDLTWTSPDSIYSLTGYVNNVGNERYKTFVNLQALSPLDSSGTQSDGRMFGGVVTAHF